MESFFRLKQHRTSAKTEYLAGLTTFLTMVYILIVNPGILNAAGMDWGSVFTATALSAVKLFLVLVIIACLLGAGGYAIYDHYREYYSTHFYEGTTINGTDVSFRTVDVIKNSIKNDISRYSLTVAEKDGAEEVLSSEDVGWAYVDDGKVDEFMESQDAEHWYKHFREGQKFEISAGTTYDKEKALAAIRKMRCFDGTFVTEPADAMLIQNAEGNYEVQPEIQGNKLKAEEVEKTILAALDKSERTVSLVEPDCYEHPQILSDNENLVRRRDHVKKGFVVCGQLLVHHLLRASCCRNDAGLDVFFHVQKTRYLALDFFLIK